MSDCCHVEPPAGPGSGRCPACGHPGRSVEAITVKALLRTRALGRLCASAHTFCATPDCPVVYFDGDEVFRREDVAVPVFQKEPAGNRTVCYCFAVSEVDLHREIAETGRSTAADLIADQVKAGRCACEIKNPQGTCCLGNVAQVTRALLARAPGGPPEFSAAEAHADAAAGAALDGSEEGQLSTTRDGGDRLPRLYRDIADWYPLLTPVGDYAAEAAFYLRLFRSHASRPPRSLLDLGSGGGHNAFHLKTTLGCTLVDLSPAMLEVSRRLNPDCEHVQGDMRSVRLGRAFDAVLVQDAVAYMASRADLDAAIRTAFEHTAPGGVALFQPDFVRETFEDSTETGGTDGGSRGLRYLEWRWRCRLDDETYFTDMVYLLRDEEGAVEAIHDRHLMGLFPRAAWLERIVGAGFRATAVPFELGVALGVAHEVFVGVRPDALG